MEQPSRFYKLDNIRFILIFLVVLGHLCEYMHFRGSAFLYLVIYSFHMPAFAFISGYCSKPKSGKILTKKYLRPYIVFQIIYICFAKYILHAGISFQFTTPYWILWYLLALFVWNLTISICGEEESLIRKLFLVSVPLALLSGYDLTIGYYLSLSRIIVMAPFFFAGYMVKLHGFPTCNIMNKYKSLHKYLIITGVILALSILYLFRGVLNASWTYHSLPYQPEQYNIIIRAFFLLTATTFTCFLYFFVPNIKIPLVTYIGQNTLGVFLFHGFVVQYLGYRNILQNMPYPQASTALITVMILLLFSAKPVNTLIKIIQTRI